MRKPYGGGGWGPPQTKIGSQKKKPALEQSYKLQGYLLLIKSNNRAKQNPVCDQALT